MTIPPGLPRDRDQAGRPRNARPRDALGRPLDHGAAGEPALPDEVILPPAEALALAQRLVDDGRPFQAHDLLSNGRYLWHGARNYFELAPESLPAHIMKVRRWVRTEKDFDYYF